MLFYLAKIFQALGLAVIAVNFLLNFPNLTDMRVLIAGTVFFVLGWSLERVKRLQ